MKDQYKPALIIIALILVAFALAIIFKAMEIKPPEGIVIFAKYVFVGMVGGATSIYATDWLNR